MTTTFTTQTKFIQNLRISELQAKKELFHYKTLYSKQCHCTIALQKQVNNLKRKYRNLEEKYDVLCAKLSDMCPNENKVRGSRKRKSWNNVKSEHTKRQRINEYGTVLLKTISQHVPPCKRAQLSLSLGDKTVNYMWKSNVLQQDSSTRKTKSEAKFKQDNDHSYASSQLLALECEEDDLGDIDYCGIFDSQGNWQAQHKRGLITVMDSYRISHEAYHELCHAGKGHFPPLYQIRTEKSIMLSEIPYIKHETVIIQVHNLVAAW